VEPPDLAVTTTQRWVAAYSVLLAGVLVVLLSIGRSATTPYLQTWSCGSVVPPKPISFPTRVQPGAHELAPMVVAAQAACAEARDRQVGRVLVTAALGIGLVPPLISVISRRRSDAPAATG
jgi:hypothetical protein